MQDVWSFWPSAAVHLLEPVGPAPALGGESGFDTYDTAVSIAMRARGGHHADDVETPAVAELPPAEYIDVELLLDPVLADSSTFAAGAYSEERGFPEGKSCLDGDDDGRCDWKAPAMAMAAAEATAADSLEEQL